MKIILHADDIGASKTVTNNILECDKILNSYSIIVTGDYVCNLNNNFFKKLRSKNISCHLNLLEGKPLSDPKLIPLLVDDNGFFNVSFSKLLFIYYFSPSRVRCQFIKQISFELSEQINYYITYFKPAEVRIDSHQHIHLIPFIFKIIINLNYNIKYIRIPDEVFIFDLYLILFKPINYIKWFILKLFSHHCKKYYLKNTNILFTNYFIGILGSGCMNLRLLSKFLSRIKFKNENNILEILFHPGGADISEKSIWKNNPRFYKFYISRQRINERNMLIYKSKSISNLLNKFIKIESRSL